MKFIFLILIVVVISGCSIEKKPVERNKSVDLAFIEPLRDCKSYSADITIDNTSYNMVSLLDCNGNFVSPVKAQGASGMCHFFAETSIIETMAALKRSNRGEFTADENPLNYNFAETVLYLSERDILGTTDESVLPYRFWAGISYEIDNGISKADKIKASLDGISDFYPEYEMCRALKETDFSVCGTDLKCVSKLYYNSIRNCIDDVSKDKKINAVFYTKKEKGDIIPSCLQNNVRVLCPNDRIPSEEEIDWKGVEESMVMLLEKGFPIALDIDWPGMIKDSALLIPVKNGKPYSDFVLKQAFPPPPEHSLIKNDKKLCWDVNGDGICYNEDRNGDGICSVEGDCVWDKKEIHENEETLYYNFSRSGHMMVIVGYIEKNDSSENPEKSFIIKNSWGENSVFYLISSPYTDKNMRRVINFNNYFRNRRIPAFNSSPLSFISDVHFGILKVVKGKLSYTEE